uniref:PWI domain-containing protein n=1 Tax=Anopheles atroparvus TaxID=41427 RepID=A0A182IR69_ANOAO
MYINNTDALKLWLTEVLEPLCDADPVALARYVLALLKKDKPEKDLIVSMKEQLDVFMAEETQPFLEQLFKVIKSEEYLKVAPVPAAPAGAATINGASSVASAPSISTSSSSAGLQPVATGPSAASGTTSHTEEVTSSSRVRVKREFTPPLTDSGSRTAKDASSSSASSGLSTMGGSMSTSSSSDRASSHQPSKGSGVPSGSSSGSSTANHHNPPSVSSSSSQKTASRQHSPARGSSKDDHSVRRAGGGGIGLNLTVQHNDEPMHG